MDSRCLWTAKAHCRRAHGSPDVKPYLDQRVLFYTMRSGGMSPDGDLLPLAAARLIGYRARQADCCSHDRSPGSCIRFFSCSLNLIVLENVRQIAKLTISTDPRSIQGFGASPSRNADCECLS
jgi:hypothetical protein